VPIECESPVTSAHHATHSASLALGVCHRPPFPLCFLFGFCFFLRGLEAVNVGPVHSPLAAFLVRFYALHCNWYCIWMDLTIL